MHDYGNNYENVQTTILHPVSQVGLVKHFVYKPPKKTNLKFFIFYLVRPSYSTKLEKIRKSQNQENMA